MVFVEFSTKSTQIIFETFPYLVSSPGVHELVSVAADKQLMLVGLTRKPVCEVLVLLGPGWPGLGDGTLRNIHYSKTECLSSMSLACQSPQ